MAFIPTSAARLGSRLQCGASEKGRCAASFGSAAQQGGFLQTRRTKLINVERAGTVTMCTATTSTVLDFIKAAGEIGLGTIRFIAVTNGAVLETIGRFDYSTKTFEIPGKGQYLTIASEDKMFECHLNMSKVARIELSEQKAKIGDHKLYAVRFKDDGDSIMLSCILQYDPSKGPGNYLFGAVDAFKALKDRFGDVVSVVS